VEKQPMTGASTPTKVQDHQSHLLKFLDFSGTTNPRNFPNLNIMTLTWKPLPMNATYLPQKSKSASGPSADLSDIDLVFALRAGRVAALRQLYDRYGKLVYGLAYKILHNPEEAEEVAQEVFLKLWSKDNYNPTRGSVKVFLNLVTRSQAINRLRSQRSRCQHLQHWQTILWSDVQSTMPLEYAVMGERSQQVQTALRQLPTPQRRVLEGVYYEGLTQPEVAQRLNIPLGTVKTRSRQALCKLRLVLQED
jgi:RNA polymerase sigma-70 factor, ECF subfamily